MCNDGTKKWYNGQDRDLGHENNIDAQQQQRKWNVRGLPIQYPILQMTAIFA